MMKPVVTDRRGISKDYDTLHCCSSITSDGQIGCYWKVHILNVWYTALWFKHYTWWWSRLLLKTRSKHYDALHCFSSVVFQLVIDTSWDITLFTCYTWYRHFLTKVFTHYENGIVPHVLKKIIIYLVIYVFNHPLDLHVNMYDYEESCFT